MKGVLKKWADHNFSDPQAILLITLLGGSVFLLMWMGKILAPVVASIVLAYLLQWVAKYLKKWGVPARPAVFIVYGLFLGLFLSVLLIIWPIIWQQLLHLYKELPSMASAVQQFLSVLPAKFPQFVTKGTVADWTSSFSVQMKQAGKMLFTFSLASLPSLIAIIIYLVLVPLMVFFFLKDHKKMTRWLVQFLPDERQLLVRVWNEVDMQLGNYIRGKVAEMIIVGVASYLVFYFFGMHYAVLLAFLVGASVLIPYVGAVMVTIPVVLVAFFQWGFGPQFAYVLLVYGVIHTIDATVLVPVLFSKAVNLHPVAIIIAILVFGGWWGFWGIFFAIPLATVVNAVLTAWPRIPHSQTT